MTQPHDAMSTTSAAVSHAPSVQHLCHASYSTDRALEPIVARAPNSTECCTTMAATVGATQKGH